MFQYYLIHYFNFKNAGGFMLVSLLCLIAVLAIVILAAKLKKHYKLNTQDLTPKQIRKLNHIHKIKEISLIESFYEMVFSSTSVLLFLSLYYIIDERIPQAALYWQKYQNIILLLFLVFSVFMTNWFDILFVPLTAIPTRQKASVRLISAFYIILILLYIKFIYHDSNYDSLIMYFITLAVGRFLYFDSTLEDIKETLQGVARNLPLLVLMGSYSAIVCWYGFHCGFLLTSNGVILSTLLAHLFMDVSIFVLDKTRSGSLSNQSRAEFTSTENPFPKYSIIFSCEPENGRATTLFTLSAIGKCRFTL